MPACAAGGRPSVCPAPMTFAPCSASLSLSTHRRGRSRTMMLAAAEATENWPEAAIAIAGIALVGSVIIVTVWQLLATWRTRMLGSRETEYRELAAQALEAQTRTAAAVEQVLAELRSLRERDERA